MSTKIIVTFNVVFPALDNLVLYLNKTNDAQPQIDALAAEVKTLTDKLFTTNSTLDGVVTEASK